MKRLAALFAVLTIFIVSCGTSNPVTEPPAVATASATVTHTPAPSATPTLPLPTATPRPLDGTLTTQVNVRSGPGTSYDTLGLLNAGTAVQVYARDAGTQWYQIAYPSDPGGRGWVAAQYVTLAAGAEAPLDATPTPSGPSGRVLIRLNVRSGPGTSFDSLGMLEADSVVALTGKNSTASWFRIDYPGGPGGYGWVTAQYIETDSSATLPVLDDFGNIVTPGAQETDPAGAPTPTLGPAYADGDSMSAPGARVTFTSAGPRQFVYASQVSAPAGDPEDWIEITPYAPGGGEARLSLSLTCTGDTASLTVELWQNGSPLEGWGSLECGESGVVVELAGGETVVMRVKVEEGEVRYEVEGKNYP